MNERYDNLKLLSGYNLCKCAGVKIKYKRPKPCNTLPAMQ